MMFGSWGLDTACPQSERLSVALTEVGGGSSSDSSKLVFMFLMPALKDYLMSEAECENGGKAGVRSLGSGA